MQPEQPQQPAQPQTTPPAFVPPANASVLATPAASSKKRTILALWLMIGPTALLVATIALYAASNYFLSGAPGDSDMFGNRNSLQSGVNILLFTIGVVSVATWLPGLIAGIVLLATRKK